MLDEPTASLPADEVARLFAVLRGLRGRGVGMIYVSHRLDEVFEVADEVAVLRDGRLVGASRSPTTTPRELVTMIVGRPPEQVFVRADDARQGRGLELRDLRIGAVGPGLARRCARARCWAWSACAAPVRSRSAGRCSGSAAIDAGTVTPGGGQPDLAQPRGAPCAPGIGLVAGDRTGESLAMPLSVRENLFLNPAASGRGAVRLAAPGRRSRGRRRRCAAGSACGPTTRRGRSRPCPAATSRRWSIARWLEIADASC